MIQEQLQVLQFSGGSVYILRTGPRTALSFWKPGIGFWPNRGEIIEAAILAFPKMEHVGCEMGTGTFVELWTIPAEEGADDGSEETEEAP